MTNSEARMTNEFKNPKQEGTGARIATTDLVKAFVSIALLLWLTAATHCAPAGAADTDEKTDEAGRARRLEKMKRSAAQFTLFSGDDRKQPLKFVETPVMR